MARQHVRGTKSTGRHSKPGSGKSGRPSSIRSSKPSPIRSSKPSPKPSPKRSPEQPAAAARAAAARAAAGGRAAPGVALPGFESGELPAWFRVLARDVILAPGRLAPEPLRVPESDANRVLLSTVRLVADLPAGSPTDVVWTRGESELLVRTGKVMLACTTGMVSIAIPVTCDQLFDKDALMIVPLAVGTEQRPAGLVMSAFTRPAGPEVVTAVWSEPLTAFAWEVLLHLAQQLCAAAGRDQQGRVLVPASIAAAQDVLILQPMARNELPSFTAQVKA